MAGSPRLQLFGVPTLEHGGQAWALPFERRSQLLALLALKRGWVGRAEVAALLWPDQDSKLAYTNLRKTLHRLAQLPWGHLVQTQGGALRFEGETDVAAFEAAVAAQDLGAALAQHAGDLLKGFDDDANEAWSQWLGYERERQRVTWRGAALAWLAGEVPGPAAVALSAQLLEADPLDEAAMTLHVGWLQRTGQAPAARQVCERYIERLASELALQPGAAVLQLRDSIGAAAMAPAAPAAAARTPPPAALPAAGDEGFIGRSAELRGIASLLEQDDCRLLCLLGPGGAGKTRLARRAMQELAPGFADGVAFVSLEEAADAATFGVCLVRELVRNRGAAAQGEALDEAVAALRGRQVLLVLDNFEPLAPLATALLQPLLQASPGLKLLVTSRVRLAVDGEWTFPVEGLPCPDAEDLDRVDAFDAVRLFVRAARRVEPGWSPHAEAAAVVEICRLVEGLPLALELAAAWVRVFPCAAIAAELRGGTELLQAQDTARPQRHASIEQVFEQSWRLLSAAERDALARLAIFRGGFTPAAARAVARASLPVLGALVDKSLLRKDEQRLRLHPLVQQLALARLDAPAHQATADAHAAHLLHTMAQLRRAVERGERPALQQLDGEGENVRAAWQHASTAGVAATGSGPAAEAQARLLADAALALMAHSDHRGMARQGLDLGRWALASPAAARHAPLRAVLLGACAHLEYRLGRLAEAQQRGTLALEAAIETQVYDAQVLALKVMGGCALRGHRLDEAREHYRFILHLAAERGDLMVRAAVLGNLAIVEKRDGHAQEAQRLCLESLAEYRRLGDVANEALSLTNLGNLLAEMGVYEPALQYQLQAQALCEHHGLVTTLVSVMANLSDLAERRGDLAAAREYGLRGLALQEHSGDRVSLIALRTNLASVAQRLGEWDTARAEMAVVAQQAQALGHDWLRLYPVLLLARQAIAVGETEAARRLLHFIVEHPGATPAARGEAQRDIATLPAAPAAPWPAELPLQELVRRIADEAALAHAPLLAQLRGAGS
jgi:predicted ATPase/DNA-binding SARP family transcriptional activator